MHSLEQRTQSAAWTKEPKVQFKKKQSPRLNLTKHVQLEDSDVGVVADPVSEARFRAFTAQDAQHILPWPFIKKIMPLGA